MIKEIVKSELKEFDKSGLYLDLNEYKKDFSFLNFFLGGRGIGKTFNIKRYLIDDFLQNNKKFMLVRRTNAQLNPTTLFNDIVNYYPNKFEFQTIDKQPTEIFIDGKLAGNLCAISTAYNLKSQSFTTSNIFYDEFIPTLNERFIKNEVFLFLEMCESVLRFRDNGNIFLSANTINLDNPYFTYFNIMLDNISSDTIIKLNECTIFKLKTNEKYLQKKNNTHFGKLVENTSFYDYADNNSWALGTANINYIDSSLVKYVDKKNDLCLYFGGNIYYKISYLNKYSCNTFIYLDTKKSNQTYTPYTNYANKKIQFLPYSDYINTLHNLENDFKNNSLKFDSTKSYNRFIPFITTQLKAEI